jgi:hypothetical protein
MEHLEAARSLRDKAKTVREYRQALAVLLPLEQHLTLEETATVLGLSEGATSRIRNQFLAREEGRPEPGISRYIRVLPDRRAREAAILDEVLAEAAEGRVVVVSPLKPLVEEKLGRSICMATLYNMLHRHGWHKLAPDTRRPKGNERVQEDWKKTARRTRGNPSELPGETSGTLGSSRMKRDSNGSTPAADAGTKDPCARSSRPCSSTNVPAPVALPALLMSDSTS